MLLQKCFYTKKNSFLDLSKIGINILNSINHIIITLHKTILHFI